MHFVAPGPGQKANTECHSVRAFAEVHRKLSSTASSGPATRGAGAAREVETPLK